MSRSKRYTSMSQPSGREGTSLFCSRTLQLDSGSWKIIMQTEPIHSCSSADSEKGSVSGLNTQEELCFGILVQSGHNKHSKRSTTSQES